MIVGSACRWCDTGKLEPGFIEDIGHSRGFARWIRGPLERGIFGSAKKMRRARMQIDAYRCNRCGHLELFATVLV
ncbi:hypothetical protein SAMN05192558_106185 [Actinokineospora alba]|uniref:Uncharacterized protein n=1 Tax=Actinokineospora alba TaxID=504798 RepID=A0A1H0PN02_9PSEU|nr:hypothetical protein C8E96_1352 [Actinokineospora alba]SDI63410.1 hypothetical protein SAMN05421871_106267 [Actinokineospora alba]SDP06170.1 hypothetical protein SAMN05192558_106185 [Actinokineospora alba]